MPPLLADRLRIAIRDSGLSEYAIAKKAGVPQPVLWRFMHEGADMRLSAAGKIARVLGLDLRKAR